MSQDALLPLVAAACAAVIIGHLWYHPKLFGGVWMRQTGMTPEMAERGARFAHFYTLIAFVAAFVAAYVLRSLILALDLRSAAAAVQFSMLLWLGFMAPALLGSVLWEHRSLKFYLITALYWFIALAVMSVIVAY